MQIVRHCGLLAWGFAAPVTQKGEVNLGLQLPKGVTPT